MHAAPKALATDLDGTLIPLEGNQQNQRDLRQLEEELRLAGISLTFATGRHIASVLQAIEAFQLPSPEWIICDVGTGLYHRESAGHYEPSRDFAVHLSEIIGECSTDRLSEFLQPITALRRQEAEKQTCFKLSYYVDSGRLASSAAQIDAILQHHALPYSLIASIDPFEQIGLIDLLPHGLSKAYALKWWSTSIPLQLTDIVYAGDSGNDSAALAAGCRAIVVGNAAPEVLEAAQRSHATAGREGFIYAATAPATSGVLEGIRHFLSATSAPPPRPSSGF